MKECIRKFIDKLSDPVCAIIPGDFDAYLKEVSVDVRSAYKKNITRYEVFKIDVLGENLLIRISDIWHSSDTRQGRPINYNYEAVNGCICDISDRWSISDYGALNFGSQKLEMFVCTDEHKVVVGYLELLSSNGLSIVHSTLGHKDKLKDNIMRYIFSSVVKMKIPDMKYLVYNNYNKCEPLYHFKEDLNIISRGMLGILRKESYK